MQNLQSLEQQLQKMRALLERSIVTNKSTVRVTEIYRRMKELELLINDRKTLLNGEIQFN
jgi:hypothetical protein